MSGLWGDCGRGRGDGLGDLVCTPAEAEAARQAVVQMNSVYAAAGSPAAFAPYVDVINADWNKYDSALVFYTWCEAKAIGVRAAALTKVIASASKLAPPPTDPQLDPGPIDQAGDALKALGKLVVPLALLAGAVVVAPVVTKALEKRK